MIRSLAASSVFAMASLLAGVLPAQTLRIGSWNLEQYGFRKDPPRGEREQQAIAEYVLRLGVAVLAVQEVGGEAPLQDLVRRLGPAWRFVLGQSGGFDDGTGRISVGFLFDTARVELLQAEELTDFPRELERQPVFHRLPVTACFRARGAGTDFRLVTVHLKAGQKPADHQKRRLEVATLRNWLAGLVDTPGEDPDVMVLGDFNHGHDAEPKELFERGGLVKYLQSSKPVDPTIAHFDAPIDMMAVARGFAEVEAATFDVHNEDGLQDKQRWMDVYSDHFPITVELAIGADDDPKATFARNASRSLRVFGAGHGAGDTPAATPAAPAAPPADPSRAAVAAAAQAPATAAAAQDPVKEPANNDPLRAGSRVQVLTITGRSFEGQIVAAGPDWLRMRQADGRVVALPVQNVVAVIQQ